MNIVNIDGDRKSQAPISNSTQAVAQIKCSGERLACQAELLLVFLSLEDLMRLNDTFSVPQLLVADLSYL